MDIDNVKDYLNQEQKLSEQLVELHRADLTEKIDYEALKVTVAEAVGKLYPEWESADPITAGDIEWLHNNSRSMELRVSTDLILEEIDHEARQSALKLNRQQPEWEPIEPPQPIRFQAIDDPNSNGYPEFLRTVDQWTESVFEGRVKPYFNIILDDQGRSPAEVLGQEVRLQDPILSGSEATQHWLHNMAQEINQDVSQIRQDFVFVQQQQQAWVEEVAPKLVDILNEFGSDKYEGKTRTIEFDPEQNQLTLLANSTGEIVMNAQWNPDEKLWENRVSSLTQDDRDQIMNVTRSYYQKPKKESIQR